MSKSNPFALLGSDSDDEDSASVTKTTTTTTSKAPPSQKSRKKLPEKIPPSNNRGGQSRTSDDAEPYSADRDTRGQRSRGRGQRSGRGRGQPRGERHRSQGKGGNKPDEKRGGHGTGNWGSKDEEIEAQVQGVKGDGADDATSPVTEETQPEEETEPEEVQLTLEEYMASQNKTKTQSAAPVQATKKSDLPAYGGDKYGHYKEGSSKKKTAGRKGRAQNTEVLLVDVKFAPSDQVESSWGGDRGRGRGGRGRGGGGRGEGRGRGGGGGGGGGGRGRGEGRGGRGRGDGRGRGRDNRRGRGDGRRTGGRPPNMSMSDFPSL